MTTTAERSPAPTGRTGTTTPVTRIREHARTRPDAVALRDKHLGIWREWTWTHYWDHVQLAGHALPRKLHLTEDSYGRCKRER